MACLEDGVFPDCDDTSAALMRGIDSATSQYCDYITQRKTPRQLIVCTRCDLANIDAVLASTCICIWFRSILLDDVLFV